MVDETQPPKGWHVLPAHSPEQFERQAFAAPSEAHRIAREEAQPYVAEMVERLADHFDALAIDRRNRGINDIADGFDAAGDLLRLMAEGKRPLPGSEGR